jgi:hypothetical protein
MLSARPSTGVMAGLDPAIHLLCFFAKKLDRRVKPGDDDGGLALWMPYPQS